MPELPEVECLTRSVRQILEGQILEEATFFRRNLRGDIPVEQFQRDLLGEKVKRVYRRSKYMLIEVDDSLGIFHLGMSGQIILQADEKPVFNHTHAVFRVRRDDQEKPLYLHYIDPRRFGWITCCKQTELAEHPFFKDLGPEPLEHDDLVEYLWQKSRNKSVAIKNFVMNAKVLVGVGNIYASEALFRAGIRPERPAHRVRKREFELLVPAIRETLTEAIAAGGTTFRDFRQADGQPGYFAISLNVYGRSGEACVRCGGLIQSTRLGGRASFFCRRCQS
ncbi:MAG: bifunctional DNA-formamidopyrimidine glycosylase/DNA-(apurinic or apyrimidinic site) lyase [Oligoflexus sp.]